MAQFIGRQRELEALEEIWKKPGFQMTVVYGRRRIGKSALLREFAKGRKAFFFSATETSAHSNFEQFCEELFASLLPEDERLDLASYDSAFRLLGRACRKERVAVIIDELPYLTRLDKGLLPLLQKFVDTEWAQTEMHLIVCGSSVNFVEDVLGDRDAFLGRRTSQLEVKPFDFFDSARFVPSYTPEEKAVVYGVTGGLSSYLSAFDERLTLRENLVRLFFNEHGYLYNEAGFLTAREFRNASFCNAIIGAVAAGKSRITDIAEATRMEQSAVVHAASSLVGLGILEKRSPVTEEENRKKVRYAVKDGMQRFWHRFVSRSISRIESGEGEMIFDDQVVPALSAFMEPVFAAIAREYVQKLAREGWPAVSENAVGSWWGVDPATKSEVAIDLVALDPASGRAVAGACSFADAPVGEEALEALRRTARLLGPACEVEQYLLFAKSGFAEEVLQSAKEARVLPVTLADICRAG